MWQSNDKSITPRTLFDQVARQAEQFRGHQQQDSQELLRFLLDTVVSLHLGDKSVASVFRRTFQGSYISSGPPNSH